MFGFRSFRSQCLSQRNPVFQGYAQQDAHEFWSCCVNAVEEETSSLSTKVAEDVSLYFRTLRRADDDKFKDWLKEEVLPSTRAFRGEVSVIPAAFSWYLTVWDS